MISIVKDRIECLKCTEFYKENFRNALGSLKYTDKYCIYKEKDILVAVIPLNELEKGVINFGYFLTHPDYRRKSLTSKMVGFIIKTYKKDKNYYLLRVTKQDNDYPVGVFTRRKFKQNALISENTYELYIGDRK